MNVLVAFPNHPLQPLHRTRIFPPPALLLQCLLLGPLCGKAGPPNAPDMHWAASTGRFCFRSASILTILPAAPKSAHMLCALVPNTWFQVLGCTRYQVPGTGYQISEQAIRRCEHRAPNTNTEQSEPCSLPTSVSIM
jgi:hypothetical protein